MTLVNRLNAVSDNTVRDTGREGTGSVADSGKSTDFKANFDAAKFRDITSASPQASSITKNYVAKLIEQNKIADGRRSYANLGAPVKASIDNAVADVQANGLLDKQQAEDMGFMIAKVMGQNGNT